jgi:hypothetical protein
MQMAHERLKGAMMVLTWAGLERQGPILKRAIVMLLTAAMLAVLSFAVPSRAAAATVTGPNGTSLTVTPDVIDDLTDEVQVTVSGTGYSTAAPGIYVSFGPQPTGERSGNPAFTDATRYYDGPSAGDGTVYVRTGPSTGPDNAELQSDGSFSIQLSVKATYTGANGTFYDGTTQALGVLTYKAHGTEASASDAQSQFVFLQLTFEEPGQPATAPAVPAAPSATAASPSALDVEWVAPADGGALITGYTVTVRNGAGTVVAASATVAGTATSTQVGGLTSDSSYNVVVSATNSVGTSANSTASAVVRTPATLVAADFAGLRWKVSHHVWTSSSLSQHEPEASATKEADGFLFPPATTGTHDPVTGEAHATFRGKVGFGAPSQQGGYRVWFEDPAIDVDSDGKGTLTAGLSFRTSQVGAVTDRGRVAIVTFDVAPSEANASDGHLVIQTPLDTDFAAAFLDQDTGIPTALIGHFTPTMTGGNPTPSNPLKVPSPMAAGFDVPVVDDTLSAVIEITTVVVETGALVLSVDDTSVQLTSPALAPDGNLHATGELGEITVVDLRSSDPGWNVTGQVGDFLGAAGASIDGAGLSWTPRVVSSSLGQVVTPGVAGDGLKDGQVLGSTEAGSGRGTAVLGAALSLLVPSVTPPGTYTGRLTLTAI